MATRLVVDELDFNLAAFAAALLVVVVIVVGGALACALNASVFLGSRIAVTDRVRVLELGG